MTVRKGNRLIAAVIVAIGVSSSADIGLAQVQTPYDTHSPDISRRPAGPGWGGHPRHPIEPGNPGPGWPARPMHPGWEQWHHPPDLWGRRGGAYEGGWFQRPYPYHLDYYRMRYGGSYAPYFGNISGPPIVYSPRLGYGPFGPGWGGAYYW